MNRDWLLSCFEKELPGEAAHAPYKRYRQQFEQSHAHQQRRPAAVALHFYPKDEAWHFILIERSTYNGQHSGQMAFPGGKPDPSDPHLEFTARRESFEEIGIPRHHGKHIKTLSNVWIPVSGFEVSPYVFLHDEAPLLQPDPREVKHIEEVALQDLLNDSSLTLKDIEIPGGQILEAHPCFLLNNKIVWGATALILNEVRMLLGETHKRN
jgi:8-oxo-dGTP pyrophosphatase MutT (NUDIX family)